MIWGFRGGVFFLCQLCCFGGDWLEFFYGLLLSHTKDLTTGISVILAVDLGSSGIY